MSSFKKKYFYKLTANIVGLLFNFVTATFVPRQLGVVNYGNYSYLINIFTQIIGFLDFKSSTYFYVKLSQNNEDKKLVSFYFHYVVVVFLTIFLTTGIFSIDFIKPFLFKEQKYIWIIYAMLFAFLLWLTDVATSFMDAIGETVLMERVRIYIKLVSLVGLSIILVTKLLTIQTYFLLQISSAVLVLFIVLFLLRNNSVVHIVSNRPSKEEFKEMFKKMLVYSSPLLGYMFLQMIAGFSDRWILQRYAGSEAQGLFSFSFSLTNVMTLFVGVLFPLLIREISIAAGENNKVKIAEIYKKFYPLIFALVAYFTAFTFVQAKNILDLLGGHEYDKSLFSFQLLLVVPLLGVFSGLNGAVIYATHKTKIFLKLATFSAPIGILLNIILIHPSFFSLGYNGLAIKTVALETISVMIISFIISKEYQISFAKIMGHFLFLIPFFLAAYGISFAIQYLGLNGISVFFIAGVCYTLVIFTFFWLFSPLLGMNADVKIIIKDLIKKK
jgi:O-antigen/teichoic acid export membrane protein